MVNQGGDTIESVRELIAIPTEIESALRAFASDCPEQKARI